MPYGKYQYIKALESRVAELEILLANAGLTDTGKDQWERLQQNEVFNDMTPSLDTPIEASVSNSTPPMRQVIPNSSSRRLHDPLSKQSQSETNLLKDLVSSLFASFRACVLDRAGVIRPCYFCLHSKNYCSS